MSERAISRALVALPALLSLLRISSGAFEFHKPDPEKAAAEQKAAKEKQGTEMKQAEFQRLLARYQKNPNDSRSLWKIMDMAHTMEPKPAIPIEADRLFAKGNAILKGAKTKKDYNAAASAYEEALKFAPWWPEAYFNIAVAFEAAKRFDDAQGALSLYLSTRPEEKDAAEARRRMAALSVKKERAAHEIELTPEEIARREKASIQGDWIVPNAADLGVQLRFQFVDDGWTMEAPSRNSDRFKILKASRKEVEFERVPVIFEMRDGISVPKRNTDGGWKVVCRLSADGDHLTCNSRVFGNESQGLTSGVDEYARSR